MDLVAARNRRNESEAVQPVLVDFDRAQRSRDGVGLRRDKPVLYPDAMARRKDDDARIRRAADAPHGLPCNRAGIRPARMRQNDNVRRVALLDGSAAALPFVGHLANLPFSAGIPRPCNRAFKRHMRLTSF